jgi:hypothetical protein
MQTMANATWVPVALENSMEDSEASRPTTSPVFTYDTPWIFGLEEKSTVRDFNFCESYAEELQPAAAFEEQYLEYGARSGDVQQSARTTMELHILHSTSHSSKSNQKAETPFPGIQYQR